jgi:hypothetical protein
MRQIEDVIQSNLKVTFCPVFLVTIPSGFDGILKSGSLVTFFEESAL